MGVNAMVNDPSSSFLHAIHVAKTRGDTPSPKLMVNAKSMECESATWTILFSAVMPSASALRRTCS